MEDIISDCIDACKWCPPNLPSIFGSDNIGIHRYVVAGDSAGGRLAAYFGMFIDPPPRVVIDVFGTVDLTDPWYHRPLEDGSNLSHPEYLSSRDGSDLQKVIEDRDSSRAEEICPWDWEFLPQMTVNDLQSFWGRTEFTEKDFYRKIFSRITNSPPSFTERDSMRKRNSWWR